MEIKNILIDLFPIVLLGTACFGISFTKPMKKLDGGGYLSLDTCKNYRGLFAVMVVFAHLSQHTDTGILFGLFTPTGYLAVTYFFFLSGYGLQKSYITKSDKYRKGFLLKRIPNILFPYIIITFIYWLFNYLNGEMLTFKDSILLIVTKGWPIVDNSWYIICILLFYIVFWLSMVLCRRKYTLMIIVCTVWDIIYAIYCAKMEFGNWWYNASHILMFGMFWAVYEQKIISIIKKLYWAITPIVFAAFIILQFFSKNIVSLIGIPKLSIVLRFMISIVFVTSVLLFSLKVKVGNSILKFFGEISLEIYLSHGLFMKLFRSNLLYFENDFLWCVLVIVSTIVFAYFTHLLFQFILKKYRLLLDKLQNRFQYSTK